MYGLFYYNYDYHELERLIAVSKSTEKLADRYITESESNFLQLVIDESKHKSMATNEELHYTIKKIEYI